jgi:hypothetical protein
MEMTLEEIKSKTLEVLGSTDIQDVDYITDELLEIETKEPEGYDEKSTYYGHYMRYLYRKECGEFCYTFTTADPHATSQSCGKGYDYFLKGSKYEHKEAGNCTDRDILFMFTPCQLASRSENLDLQFTLEQIANADHAEYPLTLSPNQEVKFSISTLDRLPAVGILDVIHQSPENSGKGELKITWGEALEWGPNPNSPNDCWNKICTVKNHSKSSQEVTVRYFFFPSANGIEAVTMYAENAALDRVSLDMVALYLAHRPGPEISASFVKVSVDGKPVDPFKSGDLPSAQGFYVNLGGYRKGIEVLLEWELTTGAITRPTEVTVGIYINAPRNRKILKQLTIVEFGTYKDSATVKI